VHEPVDVELATTLSTTSGDEVVLFGVEEAARWRIEVVPTPG
jgi:hypothetical protein